MHSKADTHMHTTFSDGLMTPEQMVEHAVNHTDLRVIAITDHETADGALVAQEYAKSRYADRLEVIIGQEFFTEDGDVVGLFLPHTMPRCKTAMQAIESIHAVGGLAIAVHPFCRIATLNNMKGVGAKIFTLPFDGVEVYNGFPANLVSNPMTRLLNGVRGRVPALGGSDSHVTFTIGQPSTRFPGHTAEDFRQAVKHGQVSPVGMFWSPLAVLRLLPHVLQDGVPDYDRQQEKLLRAKR